MTEEPELWSIYDLTHPQSEFPRKVQVVSRPDDGKVFVRMVPGMATTALWVPQADLEPCWATKLKRIYVHFAKVCGSMGFPEDMLRYDMASVVDPDLKIRVPEAKYPDELRPARFAANEKIDIFQILERRQPRWTNDRWRSFCWAIYPGKTMKLEGDGLKEV